MKIYNTKIGSNPNMIIDGVKNAIFAALKRKNSVSNQELISSINTHLGFLSSIGSWNYEVNAINRIQNILFIKIAISPKKIYFDDAFCLMSLLGITANSKRPYRIIKLRIPYYVFKRRVLF